MLIQIYIKYFTHKLAELTYEYNHLKNEDLEKPQNIQLLSNIKLLIEIIKKLIELKETATLDEINSIITPHLSNNIVKQINDLIKFQNKNFGEIKFIRPTNQQILNILNSQPTLRYNVPKLLEKTTNLKLFGGGLKGIDYDIFDKTNLLILPKLWRFLHNKLMRQPEILMLLSCNPPEILSSVLDGDIGTFRILTFAAFTDIQDLEKMITQRINYGYLESYNKLKTKINYDNLIKTKIDKFDDREILNDPNRNHNPYFVLTDDLISFYETVCNTIKFSGQELNENEAYLLLTMKLHYLEWINMELLFQKLALFLSRKYKDIDILYDSLNEDKVITYLKVRCDTKDNINYRYNEYFNLFLEPDRNEQLQSLYLTGPDLNMNISLHDKNNPQINQNIIRWGPEASNINLINTFKQFKSYQYGYLYGPFTKIFDHTKNNEYISSRCDEIISKLEQNKNVFMIGYGVSGSGKTSSLIYFKKENKDGILLEVIKNIANKYRPTSRADKFTVTVSVHELYSTKVNATDSEKEIPIVEKNEYNDIVFNFDSATQKFNLSNTMRINQTALKSNKYRKIITTTKAGKTTETINWGPHIDTWSIESKPQRIDRTTVQTHGFYHSRINSGNKPITDLGEFLITLVDTVRMVSPTPNNPQSSRSHVLIFIKLKSAGQLIVGDLAGVENKFTCDEYDTRKEFLNLDVLGPRGEKTGKPYYVSEKFVDLNSTSDPTDLGIYEYIGYDRIDLLNDELLANIDDNTKNLQDMKILYNIYKKVPIDPEYTRILRDNRLDIDTQITYNINNITSKILGSTIPLKIINYNLNPGKSVEIPLTFDKLNKILNVLSFNGNLKLAKPLFSSNPEIYSTSGRRTRYNRWVTKNHLNKLNDRKDYLEGKSVNENNLNNNLIDTHISIFNILLDNNTDGVQYYEFRDGNYLIKTDKYKYIMPYIDISGVDILMKEMNDLNKEKINFVNKEINNLIDNLYSLVQDFSEENSLDIVRDFKLYMTLINNKNLLYSSNDEIVKKQLIYNLIIDPLTVIGKISTSFLDRSGNIDFNAAISFLEANLSFKDIINTIAITSNKIKNDIHSNYKIYQEIKARCDDRYYEGNFINKSLYGLRKQIIDILRFVDSSEDKPLLFNKIPLFKRQCINYYCNADYGNCFSSNVNISDDVKNIMETIKTKLRGEDINKLVISIFGVINISRNQNDPPKMPYIDLTEIKEIRDKFMTYNYYDLKDHLPELINRVKTIWINEIDPILKKYENNLDNSLKNSLQLVFNEFNIYEYVATEPSTKPYELLLKLIDKLEELNSLSIVGTIDFLHSMKNALLTDNTCKITNNQDISTYYNIITNDNLGMSIGYQNMKLSIYPDLRR